MVSQFNDLRDELYTIIATQIAAVSHDLSNQLVQATTTNCAQATATSHNSPGEIQAQSHDQTQKQGPSQQQSSPVIDNPSSMPYSVNAMNSVNPPANPPQVNNIGSPGTLLNPNMNVQNNNFRFLSISTANINLIKNGKYINFDTLLPSSLSHPTSGYSIHLSQSSSGVEGDTPFTIQPQSSRRTIKNFPAWLSAWNIFIQAFCFFFPGFAGLLLAYQSQMTIYANRYEFSAWSTYDKLFRQNMANLHPNSPWSEVDRHLFDEVLLCAPVLAVCHTCREPGHYDSACPYRTSSQVGGGAGSTAQPRPSSTSQPPFLAPQRAAQPPVRGPRPNTSPCRFFNAGSCTFRGCRFPHVCTSCRGSHPVSQCPSRPGP